MTVLELAGALVSAAALLVSCGGDDGRAAGSDSGGVPMDAAPSDGAPSDAPAPDADCSRCEGCFSCRASACATQLTACNAEPDCRAFSTCVGGDDPAMVATCRSMHPAGEAAFCAWWGCLTYSQCDAVCEDAVICPRP